MRRDEPANARAGWDGARRRRATRIRSRWVTVDDSTVCRWVRAPLHARRGEDRSSGVRGCASAPAGCARRRAVSSNAYARPVGMLRPAGLRHSVTNRRGRILDAPVKLRAAQPSRRAPDLLPAGLAQRPHDEPRSTMSRFMPPARQKLPPFAVPFAGRSHRRARRRRNAWRRDAECQARGQVGARDEPPSQSRIAPLDRVSELADVAGPRSGRAATRGPSREDPGAGRPIVRPSSRGTTRRAAGCPRSARAAAGCVW